jgi:hypothetical protein
VAVQVDEVDGSQGSRTAAPVDGRLVAEPRSSLDDLVRSGGSGVLVVEGRPAGRLFLQDGRVVWADVPDLPVPQADAGRAWSAGLNGEVARLRTLADRVYVLCHSRPRNVRFDTERTAPTGAPVVDVEPGRLLAELDRRDRAMAGMARPVHPLFDRVGAERRLSRSVQAALTPAELELLGAVNGRRTSLDLAIHLGRGVFGTALEVARLAESAVVSVRRSAPARDEAGHARAASAPAGGRSLPRAPEAPAPGVVVLSRPVAGEAPADPAVPPHLLDDFVSTEPRLFHRVLNVLRGPESGRRDAPLES